MCKRKVPKPIEHPNHDFNEVKWLIAQRPGNCLETMKEVMFQQLISAWSLPGVLSQTLGHEVLESFRPFVFNWRWLVHHNVNNDATLGFVNVGRVSISQLHGEDAEAPDVDFSVVAALAFD